MNANSPVLQSMLINAGDLTVIRHMIGMIHAAIIIVEPSTNGTNGHSLSDALAVRCVIWLLASRLQFWGAFYSGDTWRRVARAD